MASQSPDHSIAFEGVDAPFHYTNHEWALANLPHVRIATLLLKDDDVALTDKMREMLSEGIVPDMLEGISSTKDHLKALVEVLNTALARSFVVLERLGYSPNLSPPEASIQ